MSKLRRRSRYVIKSFLNLLLFIVLALSYCEYFHYYVVLSQCKWPELYLNEIDANSEILNVMAVADTHLLGSKKGHWFDKLRREWQMHRAFQTSINLHSPDLVLYLGDLFDEGKWCSEEEFASYIERFNSLFYVPNSVDVLIAAGNHDIGFHYSLNPYLVNRFEEALKAPAVQVKIFKGIIFISINSMAMDGDDCFLCKPARLKIEEIAKDLRCVQNAKRKECVDFTSSLPQSMEFSLPILIQHYPLYRDSDAVCDESDSAPMEEKNLKFRERWECLSRESSDMLLRELKPRLVLSGHTHHGCQIYHNHSRGEINIKTHEYTVSSFSWRNKVNPTFAMISISKDKYSIYKCHLPNENSVFFLYIMFGICYFIFLLKRKIKIGNFIYFKFKAKN